MQQQHARGPGRMQQQHAEPRRAANSKTSRMQPARGLGRGAGARGVVNQSSVPFQPSHNIVNWSDLNKQRIFFTAF